MKLLIVTQTVDIEDPTLGFFVRWIEEFATHMERVEVICLREGKHVLPLNVRVHSLGKENGVSRTKYVFNFYRYLWRLRRDYDAVFVHMNPEYVVLGGLVWRLLGKRVVLWYTHRQVTFTLRVAVLFAHTIATAAPESFRLESVKVRAVGHGIDTAQFLNPGRAAAFPTPPRLVSVGRITPIKNLALIIEALEMLRARGISAELTFVGAATVPADRAYERDLHALVSKQGLDTWVHFRGAVSHAQIPLVYAEQDIFVNAAPTGGVDKAVLEAMAAGLIPVVANRAFVAYLGTYMDRLVVAQTPEAFAAALESLAHAPDIESVRKTLQSSVANRASLERLVGTLSGFLQNGKTS
ncbi:MAG: glycosyltransferase family 4 protein [Patescibacteria group bacterium]|nr:glycosyltransferase family 4 protein [Patescibacteria group bacterium]